MRPTCFGILQYPRFRELYPAAPDGIPRGNLLELSCNPFNGQIVVTFQRSDTAIELVQFALDALNGHGSFGGFARPVVEAEPRYALRAMI